MLYSTYQANLSCSYITYTTGRDKALLTKLFRFFVYVQVYVIAYDVMNTEMVKCNVYVLVSTEQESESDNSTEMKYSNLL